MKEKWFGKKLLSLLLVFSMVTALIPSILVRTVEAAENTYTRINVTGSEDGLYQLVQAQFASKDYEVELVYNQNASTGDIIVVPNGDANDYGEEGYSISINSNGTVTVTAATKNGVRYGLNDVLKQLEKNDSVSAVAPTQPYMETRALFVDTARKYFGVSWFEEIIQEMAWNGMNTLYISFSNDEGFRLLLDDMSISYDDGNGNTISYDHEFMSHLVDNPERVSDSAFLTERNASATDEGNSRVVTNYDNNKYYTQEEMERIISYANAYGITVIPELNTPGHFGAVMWYFPEYRITGTWYSDGQPHYGLDLTNQEAYNFGQALVKKYIDFFAQQGITDFCVGGDEYAQGNATNARVAEYTNELATYAESKNMTVYAWNDGQAAANGLLKDSVIVNAWNGTSNYDLINFDSNVLYYVLKGYEWKPNARTLFESWNPSVYSNGTDLSDKAIGAALAIWCDVPNKETPSYVLESMIPNLQAFGYKLWHQTSTEYSSYNEFRNDVTEAPSVNETTVLSSVGYDTTVIPPVVEDDLPEPSQGNGYELVTFNGPSVTTNENWYGSYNGANLIDGNTSTVAWTSDAQHVGDYIQVDLGKAQTVDTLTITSPSGTADICTNANVKVSVDGSNWIDIDTYSGGTAPFNINSNVRYIKVEITQAKNNWWQIAEISWSPRTTTSDVIEDGTYIIVNGTNKAMTKTISGSGFANKTVTINGNIAAPVDEVYEWTFTRQSDDTYHIQDSAGNYLNINDSGITISTTAQKITATISGGKVQLSNGNNCINFYAGHDPQVFNRWNTSTSDANNMQTLYKKITTGSSLLTLNLYNMILEAEKYNNDDHRYGSEEFAILQAVLQESLTLYTKASEENTTVTQEEINAQTEKLREAIELLKVSDTTLNYIEIPIEILDFRADGVMFEYDQNGGDDSIKQDGLYELLIDTKFGNLSYANKTVDMPGTIGNRITTDEWNGWDTDTKRTGLVESYLANGAPVYKEVTVDYVAKLIAKGYFDNLSTVTNWNNNISAKITDLYAGYNQTTDTNSNLGSWADTLSKTSTQANGGDMTWSSIETCYDLAYYILNNMWRSTQSADGENAYNKIVEDKTILRMLAGDDGYYHLDSTKQISYSGNYIFNTDLTTENNAETKFTPINGLGYENSNSYGDTTDTTNGINFHYTLHAYGSFVYNADDNLYFYFDGDDDVYFYINGKLAMDLGGAHAHCDDEIYLNDIAADLGLVEGGIYTFDMFYAERHTTQANLEFKTNIKIMDTMSTTSKSQYDVNTGESIPYGAIVDADTTVAYSFNLLNLRSVNVIDISFIDESLGTNLSKNKITLYDSNKTNGATTTITDILVYYRTYDRPASSEVGTLNSSVPILKSVSEMISLINTANKNNYSSLSAGTYLVQIKTEEELKLLLETGLPIDTQISIYGFKRNVVETDRPYINTVTSRAYYISNNKRNALNGIASQKITVLNSFKVPTDKEQIVMDFGKDIETTISKLDQNIQLNDGAVAKFYGITTSGYHNQIRTSVSSGIFTAKDTAINSVNGYGNYYLVGENKTVDEIKFELKKMLSNVEKAYAVYEIVDNALIDTDYEKYYVLVEIDIIPASIMYYETDFADGVFNTSTPSNDSTKVWDTKVDTIDSKSDQTQDAGHLGNNQTYGYDSTYQDDSQLSDGSSYYVEGQGRNKTVATFSFTGDGFDIISRTGELQGAIRVDIYSNPEMTSRVKAVTVINKSESNLELYQIPVVSVNDLEFGTYYVKVGVNTSYDSDGNGTIDSNVALDRGNEFYFDAVRVYNPIDVDAETDNANIAKIAYASDGELYPSIIEIREILLDSTTFDSSATNEESNVGNNVLFIDKTQENATIAEYALGGPNNEVYLKPGYVVAFKVTASGILGGIDIGAKSIDGNTTVLKTTIVNDVNKPTATYTMEKEINSSTSLYYDILSGDNSGMNINEYLNENGEAYILITNNGNDSSILSLTDIKLGYSDVPTVTTFAASRELLTFVDNQMTSEPNYDILSAKLSATTYKITKKIQMTVVTTTDVEKLIVRNKYGLNLYAQTSYSINEEGLKVWKVTFRSLLVGNQSFKVTGYGEDGTSGASKTLSAKIKLF